jgi:hypothetical protein
MPGLYKSLVNILGMMTSEKINGHTTDHEKQTASTLKAGGTLEK